MLTHEKNIGSHLLSSRSFYLVIQDSSLYDRRRPNWGFLWQKELRFTTCWACLCDWNPVLCFFYSFTPSFAFLKVAVRKLNKYERRRLYAWGWWTGILDTITFSHEFQKTRRDNSYAFVCRTTTLSTRTTRTKSPMPTSRTDTIVRRVWMRRTVGVSLYWHLSNEHSSKRRRSWGRDLGLSGCSRRRAWKGRLVKNGYKHTNNSSLINMRILKGLQSFEADGKDFLLFQQTRRCGWRYLTKFMHPSNISTGLDTKLLQTATFIHQICSYPKLQREEH